MSCPRRRRRFDLGDTHRIRDSVIASVSRLPYQALPSIRYLAVAVLVLWSVGPQLSPPLLADDSVPGVEVGEEAVGNVAVRTVQIEFKQGEASVSTVGEVQREYADGSLLLLTPDGQLWTLLHDEIQSIHDIDEPMQAATSKEIYEQFKEQLPPGFSVHKTRHYVMVYNTSPAYVQWAGELFEGQYSRFYNYWKSHGIKLDEPRFPLVALVFSDKASYSRYATHEIGQSAESMIGYYNMKTNRMVSYDLTGVDGSVPNGRRVTRTQIVKQVLAQPQAERTVSTIVHEAVHQLAFNSGLQVRLAANPLWVCEGLAMFFETTDIGNTRGWGAIGKVNYHNYVMFGKYLPSRKPASLPELISDDSKFRDSATASQAYPESWALTYFLMMTRNKDFVAYMKSMQQLPPLGETSPRERIDLFKQHFGELGELDQDFLRYVTRLR
ncbi:DUF1570 domain-containing protein [Aureliella helgolandensis]|nr:DUF1570 domain-containing protein [Aureliella helgolandensis]